MHNRFRSSDTCMNGGKVFCVKWNQSKCISGTTSGTTRSPSVLEIISSTLTPGARSIKWNLPSLISKTANSVTTFFTQPTPVNGKVHALRIFYSPALLLCIMATMMFSADATRSIAPPIPFTIFPGIFQLAISPFCDTSMAPRTVS